MYRQVIKPSFDYIIGAILALVLFPVFLVICALYIFMGHRNFIFRQPRVGKYEKIFTIVKFKTLHQGEKFPLGTVLRKTSLDEIPQLWNVLKGEMSLVGPRPLLVKYLEHYDEHQRKRHLEKPGITGWAQIRGRNQVTWAQRFEHDVYYVENISFLLDLRILFQSIPQLFIFSEVDNPELKEFEGQ